MKNRVLDTLQLIGGNFILACSVVFLIIPNSVLSGGVAGVAIALAPFLTISVETIMTGIIVITFIMGYLFLGKAFAVKTIASSIMYPIFINGLSLIPHTVRVDPILASIFGGLVAGVGLGLVFRTGASTGGMDIPPLILASKTNVKVSVWIMVVDFFTILLGLSAYGLNDVLIGLLSVYSTTKAINIITTLGGQQAKQVFIISDYVDDILDMILENLDRGATIIDAHGGFTRKQKQIIMTVITTVEYPQLERHVKEVDKDAFLIVSDVTEVHGQGFYKI
ncbi:hypothetical protein AOC36_00405 [Erysipelothrix larvae]|uniref:DUF2179 domain-containing protein n=1 Tax=Erysipelothrix larvae TaxID=1514105 RepID=A0A109UGG3_9FIRM|nr:YitT family protein [Erysipelothrix larvae]AMC92508.1 hypothetical protein AOC36_00405 [Erysipelothrix larvae]